MRIRQPTQPQLFILGASNPAPPNQEPIQIPEPPGYESEGGEAEEGIEDLRINLYPSAARREEGIAGGSAHGGSGVEQQKKDHSAPGDHVEHVDGYQESLWREQPFAHSLEYAKRSLF